MARASRGPVGPVLLVLAVVALAAIGLVPRGVVRAVAAEQLERAGTTALPPGLNDAASRADHLPGVRAHIGREEQDPTEALLLQPVAVEPARTGTAGATTVAEALRTGAPHAASAEAPTPDGRGPPTSI